MSTQDWHSDDDSASDGNASFDDWQEDDQPARSLFDDSELASARAALEHDRDTHGVDLALLASTLGPSPLPLCDPLFLLPTRSLTLLHPHPDFFERIRLINWIRSTVRPLLPLSPSHSAASADAPEYPARRSPTRPRCAASTATPPSSTTTSTSSPSSRTMPSSVRPLLALLHRAGARPDARTCRARLRLALPLGRSSRTDRLLLLLHGTRTRARSVPRSLGVRPRRRPARPALGRPGGQRPAAQDCALAPRRRHGPRRGGARRRARRKRRRRQGQGQGARARGRGRGEEGRRGGAQGRRPLLRVVPVQRSVPPPPLSLLRLSLDRARA